jgi:penicillin V acylase-like amidase (Ntn superfamily)
MNTRIFLGILLFTLFLAGCKPSASANFKETIADVSFPSASQLCTSFCLDNGDHCVFGTNMDHGTIKIGQVFVNKRHVMKTGWQSSTSSEYARWISKYGSVTFNLVGYQLAWGGMNEAGLMISTVSLLETEESAPDERPPLVSSFWVQYQLDNYSTVEEVIASDALVRSTERSDHYLVCDRKGDCAVIEYLGGEMVAYTGLSLPVQALTNSTYQDSLTALENGNYWKVEVFGVNSAGPAAKAGFIVGDWIIAVDGVELSGEKSLETFYSIIAQHKAGDEVSFTLKHPGESSPVTLVLKMDPLPDDTSKYTLPPDVPIQILSLSFIPTYPGDFLTRFATAVEWVKSLKPAGAGETVTYAFDTLEAVSRDDTVFSAVFDPANGRVYFRTAQNPEIRYIDFNEFDFSCKTPVMMLDIHDGGAGNIRDDLIKYSHSAASSRNQKRRWPVIVA